MSGVAVVPVHPFRTKRERYAQSNVVLTRELADYDDWGEAEIRERGRMLATEAAQIWIGPKEQVLRPESETGADDDSSGRYELRRRFWAGLSDFLVSEHPDLPNFEVRPSWTLRLPSGIRHVGIDLRLGLRHNQVGIDLWFWRAASLPLWERVRASPNPYNDLIGGTWRFEQVEGRSRARMFMDQPITDIRNETLWPEIYRWIGEKLSLVYEGVVPKLREEMDLAEAD